MNRKELVDAVAQKTGCPKTVADKVIMGTVETIMGAVAGGDNVQLVGFGTFLPKKIAAREGLNPSTHEKMHIPATTVPGFKAGKKFKECVAGK